MTDSKASEPTRSPFERHVQTVVQVCIAGLVCWLGVTVQSQATSMAGMRAEMNSFQAQLTLMTGQMNDRYTAARAVADFAVRDAQLADLRDRIRSLESERRANP